MPRSVEIGHIGVACNEVVICCIVKLLTNNQQTMQGTAFKQQTPTKDHPAHQYHLSIETPTTPHPQYPQHDNKQYLNNSHGSTQSNNQPTNSCIPMNPIPFSRGTPIEKHIIFSERYYT